MNTTTSKSGDETRKSIFNCDDCKKSFPTMTAFLAHDCQRPCPNCPED